MATATATSTYASMSKVSNDDLVQDAQQALERATAYSFHHRHDDGHWYGELKSNATITAEYVMLRYILQLDLSADRAAFITYFLTDQNADGSWGIAPHYPGDVSTSTEAYFALKLLGLRPDRAEMRRARAFIISAGGVAAVRIFTRLFLATFGLFPWKAVPELPAELILLPNSAPMSIYRFSSWARGTIVPLLLIRHHQPIFSLPNGRSETNDYLDELWCNAAEKAVPYAPPLLTLLRTDLVASAYAAADSVLRWLGGLRASPTRGYARRCCVQWILEHQEVDGDLGGIFPPMHHGLLALFLEGFELDEAPIRKFLDAMERFAWQDQRGGKRIQACVSPVWDTILTVIGLCDAGVPTGLVDRSIEWIQARQLLDPHGDWRIYRPSLAPGGWSFEYSNTWYPDVDDTAAAVLALIKHDPRACRSFSVLRAVEWILGMQNGDGGWGAFDVENDRLYLNKIPFSDMDSLSDPSTADVTGRIVEAFGLFLKMQASSVPPVPMDVIDRVTAACERALLYLARIQETTGAWYGRWGANYIYGTSNVLGGLAYFAVRDNDPGQVDVGVQDAIQSAVDWLTSIQNADGGWGETLLSYREPQMAGRGPSCASQTAWALMGLLAHRPVSDTSIRRGIRYLVRMQACDQECKGQATWHETYYTGTGFPKHFYLGYALYPHYFPMMALGRYVNAANVKGLSLQIGF